MNEPPHPTTIQRSQIERLAEEFAGIFSRETVESCLQDSFDQLARSAYVPQFLPLLAERFTRERLSALARSSGLRAKYKPSMLFICVQNAGRSQMAAALTRLLSNGRLEALSAGSSPGERIHDSVQLAMEEIGIDLDEQFPKPLTDEVVADADVVVTMGCGDACPVLPGKRDLDWQVEDPAGKPLEEVRQIRDDIRQRILVLLPELGFDPATP